MKFVTFPFSRTIVRISRTPPIGEARGVITHSVLMAPIHLVMNRSKNNATA